MWIHYESRFQALGTHDSLMRTAVARSVDVVKLLGCLGRRRCADGALPDEAGL